VTETSESALEKYFVIIVVIRILHMQMCTFSGWLLHSIRYNLHSIYGSTMRRVIT